MNRTTIGILPLAEPGHIHATIQLGRELGRAGHAVHLLGDPSDAALFADRGVPFAPLARVPTPWGPTYVWAANTDEVVLVDALLIRPAIDACVAGKRVVSLSTTFPLGYDEATPPVTSGHSPAADPAQIRAAWTAEWQSHQRVQDPHPHVERAASTLQIVRAFAHDRGWPDEQWDERAAIHPIARLPELILAPEQLDFARPARAHRRYGGPCVHADRPESAFPFARISDDRPLIYASFGAQPHQYPLADLLALLVRTARELPELQFAIASGCGDILPDSLPPNIICIPYAPQLALLRRSDLMISHGGLNGIKEALYFGVPVLVLPLVADQPGNAARIAHHGFGAAATWDGMPPSTLAGLIRTLLADAELTHRVRRLGAHLRADHQRATASAALATLLDECP